MKRWWMAALVLVLPLAGLATTTLHNELALANAEEWAIPVTGFDPRDPLRGHYIVFRYLWDIEGDSDLCRAGQCLICLTPGEDGSVTARIVPRAEDPDCPARVDPQASQISPDFISRIYVAETRALDLERQMRQTPMRVIARLRKDGILMNERLEPLHAAPEGAPQ
jgi:hypothetical protein